MWALRDIQAQNGDGIGFAIGGGATLIIPGGFEASAQLGYANGAIGYVTEDLGANWVGSAGDRYGIGDFSGPSGSDTNHAWNIRGGVKGPIATNIDVYLNGSYTHVEQGMPTNAAADGPVAGDEYNYWAFTAGAKWEAVPKLTLGPEFQVQPGERRRSGRGRRSLGRRVEDSTLLLII